MRARCSIDFLGVRALADQLTRASTSIVLNLAEGAGKHSKPDKRRFYVTARGSATESAALLDVCLRLRLLEEASHQAGKERLVRIISMLIKRVANRRACLRRLDVLRCRSSSARRVI